MNPGSRRSLLLLAVSLLLACRSERPSSPAVEQAEAANPEPGGRPAAAPAASETGEPWSPARVIVTPSAEADAAPRVSVAVPSPAYLAGAGPRVVIDAGHHNLRIRENFAVFADALRADGFVVEHGEARFDASTLAEVDLLVIVNALHPSNVEDWSLPTPSAFSSAEIDAVAAWVEAGGGLWLVADHMPFPGAAEALAARFGFTLHNGFGFRAREPGRVVQQTIGFSRAERTIVAGHPITDGVRPEERLEQLQSFTGEAFEAPADASPLFVMPADGILLLPERAWEFDASTRREPAAGWPVAAAREHGAGRVVVFGEAAMLSARYVDSQGEWFGVGIQHPDARDNLQLVLSTARWLAG